MKRHLKASQWRSATLLLLACANGFANDSLDDLYLTAQYAGGTLDADFAKIDAEEFHVGAGFSVTDRFSVEGGYSLADFEGVESNLLKGSVLYNQPLQRGFFLYGKAGVNYWDSSDADETEIGYGVGAGLVWGESRLRVTVGVEFMDNLDNDAVFDNITVYSLGVRYYLGSSPETAGPTYGNNNTSMNETTACREKHKHLFGLCDPEK